MREYPFVLEAAGIKDLPALLAIEQQSFTHPWTLCNFEEAMRHPERGRVLVLRAPFEPGNAGRGILAYCAFQVVLDEVYLHDLAVHPAHRGRGLGGRLMRLTLDLAVRRGARTALLEVRPSNGAALRLYRSLGFESIGMRRDYYTDPREDALVLRKAGLGLAVATREGEAGHP